MEVAQADLVDHRLRILPILLHEPAENAVDLLGAGGDGGIGEDLDAQAVHLLTVSGILPEGFAEVQDFRKAVAAYENLDP